MATAPIAHRRLSPIAAFVEGWRRVLGAPVLTVALMAAAVVTAPAVATLLGGQPVSPPVLRLAMGTPLTLPGVGIVWAARLVAEVRVNEWAWPFAAATGAAGYLWFWILLSGGVVDRLARGRRVGSAAFFTACGAHVWSLSRLAVLASVTCGLAWMATRTLPDVVFLTIAALVLITTDAARVRIVVEDRRSAIAGWLAGIRFVRRRAIRTAALWGLHLAVLVGAAWGLDAIGPVTAAGSGWLATLVAAASLLAGVWLRLATMASMVAFFQGDLAHAQYSATPLPIWPDSPSAEAMDHFLDRLDASTRSRAGE